MSQKAIKRSAIADFLAKRVNEEYEPMSFDFSNEDLMEVLQSKKKRLPRRMVGGCILMGHQLPWDGV